MVINGLEHGDSSIREAAVCAIENWGQTDLLPVLARHEDPEPWLADYISRVVSEL